MYRKAPKAAHSSGSRASHQNTQFKMLPKAGFC
jgi:hypothetical protein